MHIEPGIVMGAKLGLSYVSAFAAVALTLKNISLHVTLGSYGSCLKRDDQ